MTVLEDLRTAGFRPRLDLAPGPDQSLDGLLTLDVDGTIVVFAVEQKRRAPYPNEISRLELQRERVAAAGHPLFAAPFVTASVGEALAAAGWSWADEHGNYSLIAPGVRLRNRAATEPDRAKTRRLPAGSGSGTIIRQLVLARRDVPLPSVTDLANMAQVSQPRASQVLGQLAELGLVSKSAEGSRSVVDRELLLDHFLAEYRGPGGLERYLYSLDPPLVTARHMAVAAADHGDLIASADVGPDLIAPWRRPTVLVLYSRGGIPDRALNAVPAESRDSANVIVRTPQDLSVVPVRRLVAEYDGVEIPLADPIQMVWDLQDLGGAEREEAAGVMREWILNQP
jgi:hypothetical protein